MKDPNLYRGLGYDISQAMSVKDALKVSNLNWKVHELPIETVLPGNNNLTITGKKALVRPDKSVAEGWRVLDIATNRYQPTQNEEMMDIFFRISKLGEMGLEVAGEVGDGERIFVVARLDSEFNFPGVSDRARIDHGEGRVEKDDRTYLKILMTGAHVSGLANTVDMIAERQICTNGLRISEGLGRWRFIHKKKLDEKDREEVANFINQAKTAFNNYKVKAQTLRDTKFLPEVSELYLAELEQPELLKPFEEQVQAKYKKLVSGSTEYKKVVTNHILSKGSLNKGEFTLPLRQLNASVTVQPGADLAPETAWNTYNAVTYYVDHTKGRTPSLGIESAFYGDGAKMKVSAFNLAVDYCHRLA